MGILQFFPLVLIAYFPRHNKRCYESEMNSHFHSIFCLTSEKSKTICISKYFPGEALLNSFPQDSVTLDQFLQLENCNAKTELTLHQIELSFYQASLWEVLTGSNLTDIFNSEINTYYLMSFLVHNSKHWLSWIVCWMNFNTKMNIQVFC